MLYEYHDEFESFDYNGGCYFGGYYCEAEVCEDSTGDDQYTQYFIDVVTTKFELFDVFNVDEDGNEHQVTDEKFLNELAEVIYYAFEDRIKEQMTEEYNNYSPYEDDDDYDD